MFDGPQLHDLAGRRFIIATHFELRHWHADTGLEMTSQIRGILDGSFEITSDEPAWLNEEERQREGL